MANAFGLSGLQLNIESPSSSNSSAVSGSTTFSGWAFGDYEVVSGVYVSVDSGLPQLASYGAVRTDVCLAFPNAANCPNVGWYLTLDTTTLGDGVHRLNVTTSLQNQAVTNGPQVAQSTFFTINNSAATSPILEYIDAPTSKSVLSGISTVSGWAIDQTTNITSISIEVDGAPFGIATYGASRPDVCSAYPRYAGCPAASLGWYFALDSTSLANGSHTLTATAASGDGKFHTVSASFKTSN